MTDTPAHLYGLGAKMAAEGASLRAILRALLDEGATDLDLARVTKRVKRVNVKRARELIDAAAPVTAGPEQLTIIIPEDDPWYEMFAMKPSDEEVREE